MSLKTDVHLPLNPSDDPLRLTGRRLPRWAPAASMAAGLVIGILLLVTGVKILGLTWWVVALLAFLLIYGGWTLSVEGRRHATDRIATAAVYLTAAAAIIPLAWILITVITKGISVINLEFLTSTMRNVNPRAEGGGILHAVVGTLTQVGIATLISVPIGICTAIYLSEYGRGRLARSINFFVDVMTGIPSIIAGMFIFTFWILTLGFPQSGLAAGLALSIFPVRRSSAPDSQSSGPRSNVTGR